jgi:hypothetical protein
MMAKNEERRGMTDSETDAATYQAYDGDRHDRDDRDDEFAPQAAPRRRMPLWTAVLLADAGIAFVAFVILVVISIQRFGDEAQSARDNAFTEALIILFLVAALYATAAVLLLRSGRKRVAILQIAITAAVLAGGVNAAASGPPKADPSVVTPTDQFTDDNPTITNPTITAPPEPSITS